MKKRHISELNQDELEQVFWRNKKLRHDVYDRLMDNEMYWIQEAIDCFGQGLKTYSFGFYERNYIKIGDVQEFLDGIIEIEREFGFLKKEFALFAEKTLDLICERDSLDYDDKEYEKLDNRVQSNIHILKDELLDIINIRTQGYSEEQLLEHFVGSYFDAYLDKRFYVDDSYTLYEEFTKSYL